MWHQEIFRGLVQLTLSPSSRFSQVYNETFQMIKKVLTHLNGVSSVLRSLKFFFNYNSQKERPPLLNVADASTVSLHLSLAVLRHSIIISFHYSKLAPYKLMVKKYSIWNKFIAENEKWMQVTWTKKNRNRVILTDWLTDERGAEPSIFIKVFNAHPYYK